MSEAIGTLAEVVAGMQPLMSHDPPLSSAIEPVINKLMITGP